MKANDTHGPEESQLELAAHVLKQAAQRELAGGVLRPTRQRFISSRRNAGQRRFDVAPDSLGPKPTRVFAVVSRPIRLSEGAAPIRRVLIFDDHPATIRLLDEIVPAEKRKDRLALLQFSALILLLMLVMFWRML